MWQLAVWQCGSQLGEFMAWLRRPVAGTDMTGESTRPFAQKQGQLAVPATVLFDRNHQVVYADVGFAPEQLTKLRAAVDEVVNSR
jgi:hypothetical protein